MRPILHTCWRSLYLFDYSECSSFWQETRRKFGQDFEQAQVRLVPGDQGIATMLMDAAEQLARERGIATLGITVGLFDEYGPAQRLYGQRGYVPDGRGACRGQQPLSEGMQAAMDHDLIMWLTKDLTG